MQGKGDVARKISLIGAEMRKRNIPSRVPSLVPEPEKKSNAPRGLATTTGVTGAKKEGEDAKW
jgi:hypothetical protein